MALNVDAIKARLASLNKKGGNGNNSNPKAKEFIWKPSEGKQDIRIVPYQYQPDNPFIELKFHYDFAGKTFLSPSSFNKADPIVELSDRLKKNGDKDDWRIGRDLEPKMRTFVPIIVRGKESEGVKFWGFGVQVYKQLMAAMSEPDYGDITDLVNGYDIRVEFTKKSGKKSPDGKQEFPETTIMIKPKQKPVIDTTMSNARDVLTKITTAQPNILDIFTVALAIVPLALLAGVAVAPLFAWLWWSNFLRLCQLLVIERDIDACPTFASPFLNFSLHFTGSDDSARL